MSANEKHKDSVFSLLFGDPDVLRELYSAIEGVNLPSDIPIDINTLSNVLFKGKINDLSFLIDNRLVVIIEHQSTVNENMPVRLLIYIAEIYKKILDQKKIFQERLLQIPTPEFIVLYNGTKPYEDHKTLRLSDAFKKIDGLQSTDKTSLPLELVVQVYNINKGHNPHIMNKSRNLDGYSIFIDKIRESSNNSSTLEEAIRDAVKYCLENNILTNFLNNYKSEVMNMILEDLTTEEWLSITREEAREIALEEGREQGLEEGREQGLEQGLEQGIEKQTQYVLNLIAQGFSTGEIKQYLEQKTN